ncbi:hypothetical protein SDRG_07122 [Saprolegnia diclina VS20]|uniref:Amino acid permease/ SLC12A domain-containing protein n=1 Tax=Saprolegnia diclina (strain VS20) TaxID=1156394 RepID=T0RYF0_SAPDV|nr:hypothetical protein SDRG_07122 [Saprolegnia diclina VS20]EQC35412.1 hypothetical protein SDRG_07122 [Saprolegnia diclina VS20]|eukprot:XP_008611162.1 hypothetical protein SDRG_07122 [Saprolegnia diclina VS20]
MGSAASHASFATLPDDGVRGGISAFMKDLPAHARFFVGLEGLSTVADSVHRPVDVLAHGHVRAMLTQCALGTGVFVITLGVPMSTDEVPTSVLSRGFALGWSISEASASIFALPPTVATLYGYVLATSSILASMTKSKLLPAELGELHVRHLSHSKALVLTSLSSLALCSLAYGVPMLERTLYAIAMVYAACVYIASSYASLHMKRRFGQLQYTWSNPLGRAGAVFGALVWAILLLALLGFQDDSLFIAVVVLVSSALLSACYHLYAKHRQSLSPEEQHTLFFAHVAFRNKRRHHQRTKVMRFGMSGMSQMASLRSTGRHGMVGAAKGVPPLVEREKRSSVIMKAETSLNLNTEGDKWAMRRNVSSRSTDNLHATEEDR